MIKLWKFFPVLISLAVCLGLLLVPAAMGVSAAEPASGKVGFRMPAEVKVAKGATFEVNVTIYNPHGVNMCIGVAAIRWDVASLLTVNDITLGDWPVEVYRWIGVGEFEYDAGCIPVDKIRNTTIVHCTVNFTANATTEGTTTVRFVTDAGEWGDIPSEVYDDSPQPQNVLDWAAVQNMTVIIGTPKLTVDVSPAGKGDVKVAEVIPSTYPNITNWKWDEVVNLEAVNSVPGYTFDHWSGDLSGSATPTSINMDANKTVTANFLINQYNLTINSTAGGSVTTPGEATFGPYDHGMVVNLTATPDADYAFVNWTGDVSTITNVNSATTNITMSGNYSITANFAMNCPCGDICVNTAGWWRDGGTFNASSTPIQDAVNNATSGDTICVRDGTYHENINVNKDHLTIRSENGTANCVVNASNPDAHVFEVTADWVNITGFTVENATGDYMAGIHLETVNHCNISSNNLTNNYDGIYLDYSSNNTLSNNTANSNTHHGIYLDYSSNYNMLTNNTVLNNTLGIWLCSSSNNNLINDRMSGNRWNFGVDGNVFSHFIQDIDASNKVDGKPIYYWVNHQDEQVPSDAGFVGIVNSTNITAKDLILTNNMEGVLFAYTDSSRIENVTTSNNFYYGMHLYYLSNSTLSNNTANSNGLYGMYLYSSSDNTLTNNTAYNSGVAIYLDSSSNNVLSNNTAERGYRGIRLCSSSNNTLTDNTASSNNDCGIYLDSSNKNTLTNNTASNNTYGILLSSSSTNIVSNNYFNNTNNAYDDGNNTWNTTKTLGRNIVGGPYLGGNYWSDYSGNDTNGDGFGDTPYNITGGANKDYLPLLVPTGATLEVHVTFLGRGSPPDSKWIEGFVVRFFENGNETAWSPINATTDDTGIFAITSIIPGTYDIGIKNYTTHSKMVYGKVFTPGNTTVASFGTLIEADCDDSDKTDASDYSRVLNNYGEREIADPTFWVTNGLWKADYNRDEKINGWDYASVLNNYGDRGDIFYYTH